MIKKNIIALYLAIIIMGIIMIIRVLRGESTRVYPEIEPIPIEVLMETHTGSLPEVELKWTLLVKEKLSREGGVNYYGGRKETFYNLDMSNVIQNAKENEIYGDYWVRDDGVKMYGKYVIVASAFESYPYGSLVQTSLGKGIVLDTGEFAETDNQQIDIATDW